MKNWRSIVVKVKVSKVKVKVSKVSSILADTILSLR